MAELAAELIYMSWHHEEELSHSLGLLKRDPSDKVSIRDIRGLSRIHDFFRAVSDDHEYSLRSIADRPIVTWSDCSNNHFTITPNILIEALQNYREELENVSKPKL